MALDFDGTDQYLIKDTPAITTAPATMVCWFYPHTITDTGILMYIGDFGTGNNRFIVAARGATGGDPLTFQTTNDPVTTVSADTTIGYSANTWQHACGTIAADGGMAIYLDGGSKGTAPSVVDYAGVSHTLIGARVSAVPEFFFNGVIAEAAVWSAALTDAEAAILALGYSPLFVRPQSLVAYWPILGRTSPEIDLVGGIDMTLTNGPTTAIHPRIIYPQSHQQGLTIAGAPPAGAIMNQLQYLNFGADLYNGTLIG